MEDILIGVTDRSIPVFILDPASTTGAGKTGLVAANITVTYTRYETDNDVVHSDVTSSVNDLSALTDAHNDWGWKEVSSTLSKGLYRLDVADAVFAAGAWYAVVQVTITSGTAAATPKAFRLTSRNDLDGVRLGLSALPNAAADAAGGLPISDAGGLDIDTLLGRITGNVALASVLGALNDAAVDGDPTTTDTIMQYVKQLVNTLVGTAGIPTYPAAAAPGNAVSLSEAIRQIYDSLVTVDDFLDTEIAAILAAVDTEVAAIKAKTDNLPEGIQKNTALANFEFFMVDSADHVTGKTGLTLTCERSIDGGAFATMTNSATEVSAGIYKIDLAAADTNGDFITYKFTSAGADATLMSLKTES